MFISELKEEFYDHLIGERVLVFVSLEVDSVCTTKILQYLFDSDAIVYTLIVVDGLGTLKQAFMEYDGQAKYVILINCGGTVDLMEALEKPKDTIFFIFDSHRPIHVLNVYNESNQVRIVMPSSEIENIPPFDVIFRSDEMGDSDEDDFEDEDNIDGDEDNDSDDEAGRKRKRRRLDPENIQRRKERAEWAENMRKVLFDYTQYSYFGPPTCLFALELAWNLTRDHPDLIWWTIVGLTDYFVLDKLPRNTYTVLVSQLQDHVARVTHSSDLPRDCLKIGFETELALFLYRHWTVYESIKMTPYTACKFKTWCLRGEKRFHEFLAELGLPLAQCRQKFSSMDLCYRKGLFEMFTSDTVRNKYKLDDITVGSFVAQIGYRRRFSAIDSQLAILALLESPSKNLKHGDRFTSALHALSITDTTQLDKGLELAQSYLQATFKQVQSFIDMKQTVSLGPFLFVHLPETGLDTKYFEFSNSLSMLAKFTLRAVASVKKHQRWTQLPLVLMAPKAPGIVSVVGIPPLICDSTQNLFGKAFEYIAEKMPESVDLDCFDATIAHIRVEDKRKFLDHLLTTLI